MDFSKVESLKIKEGEVTKIEDSKGEVIWERPKLKVYIRLNAAYNKQVEATVVLSDDPNSPVDYLEGEPNEIVQKTYDRDSIYQLSFDNPEDINSVVIEGRVKDLTGIFGDTKYISADLSKLDTSETTDMTGMFSYSENNYNPREVVDDFPNFDTSNVIYMGGMFDHCYWLASLDLSKWDISKVTDMENMFSDCTNLTTIGPVDTAPGWQHKPDNYQNMFANCPKFKGPYPSWYNK